MNEALLVLGVLNAVMLVLMLVHINEIKGSTTAIATKLEWMHKHLWSITNATSVVAQPEKDEDDN